MFTDLIAERTVTNRFLDAIKINATENAVALEAPPQAFRSEAQEWSESGSADIATRRLSVVEAVGDRPKKNTIEVL